MVRKCIDLFSGCGGLSLGLEQSGFEHIFAVEQHPDAFATYQRNLITGKPYERRWPNWLPQKAHDIRALLTDYKQHLISLRGSIDLVAGGPPCQGFSMNGKRDPHDPRSSMVEAYLEFVEAVRPKIILMENVRGFLSMPHPTGGKYPAYVKKELQRMGYLASDIVIAASDWGVPQKRLRYILIAVREDISSGCDPVQTLLNNRKGFLQSVGLPMGETTVEDALSDLLTSINGITPDPEYGDKGFMSPKYKDPANKSAYLKIIRKDCNAAPTDMRLARHSPKVTSRMAKILDTCELGRSLSPDNRKKLGIKKRSTTPLNPRAISPTITTLPDDLIHYSEPRTMTVREHARIQSFPDWFSFCGRYTTGGARRKFDCPRYTQVGNAVPPLLARGIGSALMKILSHNDLVDISDTSKASEKGTSVSREITNSHEGVAVFV